MSGIIAAVGPSHVGFGRSKSKRCSKLYTINPSPTLSSWNTKVESAGG